MTLADILKPSLTILWHGEKKGLQIGAGIGTLIALPGVAIRSTLINPSDDPPLVAVAKCAGLGAVAGAGVVGVGCVVKMCRMDREEIRSKAEKICANGEEAKMDRAALAGAGVGLGLVGLRVVKMAEGSRVGVWDVVWARRTGWEVFCFVVLGAALGVGVVKVVERVGGRGDVAEAVAETVEQVVEAAKEGVDEVEKKVEEKGEGES